jgi:hypothetical protein
MAINLKQAREPPECASLLQGEIVNEPRGARELGKALSLLGDRLQLVAEGALNHRLFLHESNREGNSPNPHDQNTRGASDE